MLGEHAALRGRSEVVSSEVGDIKMFGEESHFEYFCAER